MLLAEAVRSLLPSDKKELVKLEKYIRTDKPGFRRLNWIVFNNNVLANLKHNDTGQPIKIRPEQIEGIIDL